MGQRTNILLQIEGRSGAHLNHVYHLQWGCYKYMPMAFLHFLSGEYFRQRALDIFDYFTIALQLDGLKKTEGDWGRWDFNKLADCQNVLQHCDNNNGAMVVVSREEGYDTAFPAYKLGFLIGPEDSRNELPFARWVSLQEYLQHQHQYDEQRDDIFARAFDALTTLFGTQHFYKQLS